MDDSASRNGFLRPAVYESMAEPLSEKVLAGIDGAKALYCRLNPQDS